MVRAFPPRYISFIDDAIALGLTAPCAARLAGAGRARRAVNVERHSWAAAAHVLPSPKAATPASLLAVFSDKIKMMICAYIHFHRFGLSQIFRIFINDD